MIKKPSKNNKTRKKTPDNHILIRILSGFTGISVLALIFNHIFIDKKGIPLAPGYYGILLTPLGIIFAAAFLSYAIGGNRLLKKIVPTLSKRDDSHNSE